jgi:hypothetical protein
MEKDMQLAVIVDPEYKDWETFQSVMDAAVDLYNPKWIVAPKPHTLITLYCKIDLVACYINSLREFDKYDMALVFSTRSSMHEECELLCFNHKPYFIYKTDIDEFFYIEIPKRS